MRMPSSARLPLGRECGSNSWRTAPKEKFCSSGAPRAARTVRPRPRASSAAARNSDVLPMPAGPSTTTRRPRALSASARLRSSSPSSRSRSSREPPPRSPDIASAPRPRVTTRLWQYRSAPEVAKSSVDKGQKVRAAATMPPRPRRAHPRGMAAPARTAPVRAARTTTPKRSAMTLQTDPSYVFQRSSDEYTRLTRQAALVEPMTEMLFRDAGITPGMRVLDVGSGVGDVALLAARLVGPHGSVVGIDIDGTALEVARARAGTLGLQNLTFNEGDVRSAETGPNFDAAVGRLVLGYLADPAEALRAIAERVHTGGIVAFQELDLDPGVPSRSFPEGTLWEQTGRLVIETFARAGTHVRMGRPRRHGGAQ